MASEREKNDCIDDDDSRRSSIIRISRTPPLAQRLVHKKSSAFKDVRAYLK